MLLEALAGLWLALGLVYCLWPQRFFEGPGSGPIRRRVRRGTGIACLLLGAALLVSAIVS